MALEIILVDLVETLANSEVSTRVAKLKRVLDRLGVRAGREHEIVAVQQGNRLGAISEAVLDVLREVEIPVSVQQVHQTLELQRGPTSYSSVKTVLNREANRESSPVVKFKRGVYCLIEHHN